MSALCVTVKVCDLVILMPLTLLTACVQPINSTWSYPVGSEGHQNLLNSGLTYAPTIATAPTRQAEREGDPLWLASQAGPSTTNYDHPALQLPQAVLAFGALTCASSRLPTIQAKPKVASMAISRKAKTSISSRLARGMESSGV